MSDLTRGEMASSRLGTLIAGLRSPERIEQVGALLMRIASAGIGYALLAGAAHVTKLSDFSDFALVMAATGLFGAVATLGQETLLLRRLPILVARGLAGYRDAIRRSAAIVAGGLLFFAITAMIYGRLSFTTPTVTLIALLGALVVASGAAELLFSIQRGSGSVLGAVFRRELMWKLVLLSVIATLFVTHRTAGVATLAGWYLVGTLAAVAASLGFVWTVWRRAPRDGLPPDTTLPRENAWAFLLLNLIAQAGTQLDVLVLGLMTTVPAVQLGAYYAAQRTIQILYILPYGASITAAPRIPTAWAEGRLTEITRLSRQISRELGLVVLILAGLAFLFRAQVMGFFRPEFAPYALILPVLCIGPLASALGGLHNMVAPMCGMEKAYSRWRLAIIVTFLLAKIGAALTHSLMAFAAVSAAEGIAIALVGVAMARRRLGIWIV